MICDANVILRYILDDIEKLSQKAAEILENEPVFIPFEVVAEVVYVLEKVYKANRRALSEAIIELAAYKNIETVNKDILTYALKLFSQSRLDFVDTVLCGYSYVQQAEIITFDRKLQNKIQQIRKTQHS